MVLSLDALFGLPRKKAAGKSHRDPLHGDVFFDSQSSVDEHVATYRMPSQRAGNVRSFFKQFHCLFSHFSYVFQ